MATPEAIAARCVSAGLEGAQVDPECIRRAVADAIRVERNRAGLLTVIPASAPIAGSVMILNTCETHGAVGCGSCAPRTMTILPAWPE